MSGETPRARHGSGLYAKVDERHAAVMARLERIDSHLEASRSDFRDLDRHVIEVRVMLEGVSKRIDDVRAEYDRRLRELSGRHEALDQRVDEHADAIGTLRTSVAVNTAKLAAIAGAGGVAGAAVSYAGWLLQSMGGG